MARVKMPDPPLCVVVRKNRST